MSTGITDLGDASRRCAGLAAALFLVAVSFHPAQAQTNFAHDAAGNRTAQKTAATPAGPFVTMEPSDQLGKLGGTARFSVIAGGRGPFTYQWMKNGVPISGATSDTLVLESLSAGDFTPSPGALPSYSVEITNAQGTVASGWAELYLDSLGAGLPDWWRQQYFGSLAAVSPYADADGDGVSNGQEYQDRTEPNNAASRRARVTLAGPPRLMSKSYEAETYAGGSSVTVNASHSGELQFGGFTGTHRSRERSLNVVIPGDNNGTGDVVLKGLYGSMPVEQGGELPVFAYSDGSQASVEGFATSPGGMWIAYGLFNQVSGQPRTGMARFYPDGSLDTSFAPNPNSYVNGVSIQKDGSVIVAGYFAEIGGQQRAGVARFTEGGALDTAFAPTFQGAGDAFIACLEVQRDGKILLGGDISNGSTIRYLVRLNADGTTDASFTTAADARVTVLRQQADGKILMGGEFTQVNGTATPKLVRLNLDGTLDGSFNVTVATGAITSTPARVLVQADGKILVGGAVQVRLNGSTVTLPLVRLHANGTLDTAFTQKVQALIPSATFADIALQTDGRIVGVGTFTVTTPSVVNAVRFKPDGSVDPDCFVISRPNAPVRAVAAQTDGSLLMGGQFSSVAVGIAPGNNHAYFVTPKRMTWNAAEAHAIKLGGHLVSIGGPKENSYIADTVLPLAGLINYPVWHGLNDAGVQTMFAWASGEPVGFTNWNPGEPSQQGGENYGMINWRKAYNGGTPYTWDDTVDGGTGTEGPYTQGPYYGVIEVDPGSTPDPKNWVAGRDLAANEAAGTTQERTNPNASVPQWSYGTRATQTSATSELNLYTTDEHSNGPDWEGWTRAPGYATLGAVTNPAGCGAPTGRIRTGEVIMHPPSSGFTVARWTAPAAGSYNVAAVWQDVDWNAGDGCNASIVKNGTTVVYNFDFDNGNGAFVSQVLALAAGDIIDFPLGGRSNDTADTTRFNAMITCVTDGTQVWVGGRDLAANEKPDGDAKESTNPNQTAPAWSYGQRSTYITSGLNLYVPANHYNGGGGDGPMQGWAGSGNAGLLVNPGVTSYIYNFGFGPNIPFNPGDMLLGPAGHSGPFPVVRWTAPAAGRYDVLAMWQDIDFHGGNGIDAFMTVNGGQVYGQNIDNAHGSSTVQSLDLKAGDQVDFLVGTRGDYSFDTTKFNVAIARSADAVAPSVPSSTVTLANSRSEITSLEQINWAAAAPNNVDVSGNPFVIESSAGVPYHVRKATTGPFRRLTQSISWNGNFTPGDAVLQHGNSDGPVIIEAASRAGVFSAIGMQIMPNMDTTAAFTATIRAYDVNGTLLGTFTKNGTANANADNSAIFIGVKSTVENIHSISVDTDTTTWGGDFAINQVSIQASNPGSLASLRSNFARLVPSNTVRPLSFYTTSFGQTVFPANGSTTMLLISEAIQAPVTFAVLESSADGQTYLPFSYGTSSNGEDWSFPVAALPPGANYFRAMLRTTDREEVRTHAVGPLITPPVVTSALVAEGEVGTPFTYTGTATGQLTDFAAISLPSWATASFDANSSRVTISGTPTAGGTRSIMLQPANAAGSTSSYLALTIVSSLDSWQNLHFTAAELANESISGPLGDATGAGISNLMKYALGIPPKQPGTAGLPAGTVSQDGSSKYLTLVYNRDTSADVTMTVEVSADLVTWNSGPAYTTEVSRVPQGGTMETVTVRDNVPSNNGQKRFMRLRVTQ